ncbi:MAG TPA: 50S ribosomal protein L23 [Candidatus Paceibacterota bacterium]
MIIIRPYITERSNDLAVDGTYCFVVGKRANKPEITKALGLMYKAKPVSIRIINLPKKKTSRGAKVGWAPGVRKAYVKFPKGTKIEFV